MAWGSHWPRKSSGRIIDAAARLMKAETLGVWGIVLDAELGDPAAADLKPHADNDKLVLWYRDRGFQSLLEQPAVHTHAMFAKLDWLYRP